MPNHNTPSDQRERASSELHFIQVTDEQKVIIYL